MATRKRWGRLTGTALVGTAFLTAGVVAGPALADDTSYLSDLHNAGIHDVGGGDAALLVTGWKLCTQLSYGATPVQLTDLALQRSDSDLGAKGLTPEQASALIGYAQADLCPRA